MVCEWATSDNLGKKNEEKSEKPLDKNLKKLYNKSVKKGKVN